jgi:hypothetical protein
MAGDADASVLVMVGDTDLLQARFYLSGAVYSLRFQQMAQRRFIPNGVDLQSLDRQRQKWADSAIPVSGRNRPKTSGSQRFLDIDELHRKHEP